MMSHAFLINGAFKVLINPSSPTILNDGDRGRGSVMIIEKI